VKGTLGFTSPPYWVGKEYEKQKSVNEIDDFIKKACISYNSVIEKDNSRIVINTGTGFTTSFDKKKKRQVLLLIDKWANGFYDLGWNLRHIRHWLKEGQLKTTSPKTDLIDQHCEFLETFENDESQTVFQDIIPEDDVEIANVFYNTSGHSKGQNRTGRKWALRSYWNDIKGNANQNNHCASFPVELVARHLLLYTTKQDIVIDLFMGAGTTIICCEKMDRVAYGCDFDAHYCDVIVKRYIDFVGTDKDVFVERNGGKIAFSEVSNERNITA
jgi:DNA modification methylase